MPENQVAATGNRELVHAGLESLDREVTEIMECLRTVLRSASRPQLAEALPWLQSGNGTTPVPEDPGETAQVYSIAFQLLDMIEEHEGITGAMTAAAQIMGGLFYRTPQKRAKSAGNAAAAGAETGTAPLAVASQ